MEYFGNMIPQLKHKLSRILSAQESERYKHQKRPLVVDTKGSVPQTGEVGQALVATTGFVWSSKGNFRSRALQQAQEAEIIVVEEAQEAPDVKTTLSLSHVDARSLLLLVGDEQREVSKMTHTSTSSDARSSAHQLDSHYRPPHAIPRVILQLVATLGPIDSSLFGQHLTNICKPTSPLLIHAPMAARAAADHTPASAHLANVLNDALPLHLQDAQHAPPSLAFHSPTGTTLALLHLLGQADAGIHLHQASTAMEAAGLVGHHKWGVILPTSARIAKSIYEPALASIYPTLCEVHDQQWRIGTPRPTSLTGYPTGPRYIRLHPSLYENRTVTAEEARQVFHLITQGMHEFRISSCDPYYGFVCWALELSAASPPRAEWWPVRYVSWLSIVHDKIDRVVAVKCVLVLQDCVD